MNPNELPTPCAIVDLGVLQRNAVRMAERAHRLEVRLRPHVKTHKCVEAARLQVAGHFGGITVSGSVTSMRPEAVADDRRVGGGPDR
jgi:D-serine deaminase-like pyridoxal phosphate-dependent protein